MNYFFDTEFVECGPAVPITLISIGVVSEDGRELYVENSDADLDLAVQQNPWLKDNVIAHLTWKSQMSNKNRIGNGGLTKEGHWLLPHKHIGQEILKFIGMDPRPKFWAYFADYDWVIFCQLFGRMVDLPETFPNLCRDLKQEMLRMNVSRPLIQGCGPAHNALSDARWGKALFGYLKTKGMIEF